MPTVNYEELKTQLDTNEKADYDYRERRQPQWTENYQLYRDKVVVNRLTQRQSINVPLIKGIIKTVQANTDEFPDIEFEELGNEKDKEIILNELWKDFIVKDKMEIKDVVDKKQDFLYGKTWQKFNILNGRIVTEIKEPFDMLVDRYADPSDLETADHISEHGIFRTIGQLKSNPNFDPECRPSSWILVRHHSRISEGRRSYPHHAGKERADGANGSPGHQQPCLGFYCG